MQVKLDTNIGIGSVPSGRQPAPVPESPPPGDSVEIRGSTTLNQALARETEVRASEVERGKQLISSDQYPPAALIQGISRLLAESWNENGSPE